MSFRQQIYRLTEAGADALANPPVALPFPCRRILALLQGDAHFSVIRAGLGVCEEQQVAGWLHDLEVIGLIKAEAAGEERDLDFTGSLSLAALAARHNTG